MSHIQLLFGLKKKREKVKLNLPKNWKTQELFSQLPYLANLEDTIFQNEIQNIINNRDDLQKYLLATGDLNDSIQEILDLVVNDGRLNDVTGFLMNLT